MTATAVAGDRVTDPALCSTGNSSMQVPAVGIRPSTFARLWRHPLGGRRSKAEGRPTKAGVGAEAEGVGGL